MRTGPWWGCSETPVGRRGEATAPILAPKAVTLPKTRPREQPGIAERVRFWEEQDRINQELIPRVVQQAELLSKHVTDHENLQEAAAGAAREAVEEAHEETKRQLADAVREREELGSPAGGCPGGNQATGGPAQVSAGGTGKRWPGASRRRRSGSGNWNSSWHPPGMKGTPCPSSSRMPARSGKNTRT